MAVVESNQISLDSNDTYSPEKEQMKMIKSAVEEEIGRRFIKVGKFRLCFPFSAQSADLSVKINLSATAQDVMAMVGKQNPSPQMVVT